MSSFAFILPTWPVDIWAGAMRQAAPKLEIRSWPDNLGRVEDISYAAAWLPPANVLGGLPNLKVIFSLGAGVDAILSDPTLPKNIPVVRVNDPDLTNRMSEYIVLHVLMHHRQQRRLDANQKLAKWDSFPTHAAKHMTIGIMGLGVLGQDAAAKLAMMGFNVVGWSRSQKQLSNVTCYSGTAGLAEFLGRTDILVCLLPATAETDGLINASLIRQLSRKGPFGSPIIINAGRGRQQVEADILDALDSGALYAATLDVFAREPLPADSKLWSHPRVTVTPHAAADSEPLTICSYVAAQIARYEQGLPLENLVDRARGY
jgi:glyoxylate/hydroxypyruvate reductase A